VATLCLLPLTEMLAEDVEVIAGGREELLPCIPDFSNDPVLPPLAVLSLRSCHFNLP
jgi:hypothetical protein